MKMSKAFAAFRQSLITDKNHAILQELAPAFNAAVEDIRRQVEDDFNTYHNQAKADNLRKTLTYDLILHRQEVLRSVQSDLRTIIDERLHRDGAQLRRDRVDNKVVIVADFPDGSQARVPTGLWVDYSAFDRV